jgi:hypothetical protein
MNKRLLTLIAIFTFALTAAGCAGLNGAPQGLPSMEMGFTEIGNPDEDEAQLKGVYVNNEFDVAISYPVRFSLNEIGSSEAFFSSDDGEQLTYSFMWLEDGDTFDSFIADVRGGFDGLENVSDSYFDEALCKEDSELSRSTMKTVECYYYRETEYGSFVMVKTGIVMDDAEFETSRATPGRTGKRYDNSSDDEIPSVTDIPDDLHAVSSDNTDSIPAIADNTDSVLAIADNTDSVLAIKDSEDLQAVVNEDSDRAAVKRHPLSSRELSVMKGTELTSD